MRTLVLAGLLAACNGSEQGIEQLVPEIVVTPDAVDFGPTGLLTGGTVELLVSNGGRAPLLVDLSFAEGDPAVFSVEDTELELLPDETIAVPVHFRPETYLVYDATLHVASNDLETPDLAIPLVGEGVHEPAPDIEIAPLSIDFGAVTPPGTAMQFVTVRNTGDAPLTLGRVEQAGSGAFLLATDPSDAVIAAGGEQPVIVQYAPATADGDNGQLVFPSDDPDEGPITVVLLGNGGGDAEYPVAAIDCPGTADPPEWVGLDGGASDDPSGLLPLSYEWTLTERPSGSQTGLTYDDTVTTAFFADLAGDYEARLVVANAAGVRSVPAICPIAAVPSEELHVELTWDTSRADIDLHLREDGYELFDQPHDVTWCNTNPNWGASGGADDPSLDLDDRSGFGPENINLEAPGDGRYDIAVHYYEGNGDGLVTATVRVYAFGELVDELSRSLSYNDVWEVGQVAWPAGTVGRVDSVAPATARKCY